MRNMEIVVAVVTAHNVITWGFWSRTAQVDLKGQAVAVWTSYMVGKNFKRFEFDHDGLLYNQVVYIF